MKKVSDIVAEIAAASREQSAGIGQVNQAVLQMDELTQQNAALVEQATSASQAMAHEAHALHEMMGAYQLGDRVRSHTAGVMRAETQPAARAAKPAAKAAGDNTNEQPAPRSERRGSVPRSRASGSAQVAAAAADGDSEWQEF